MKKVPLLILLWGALLLLWGCAIPTHDFRTSQNIERSIDDLVFKRTTLKEKALCYIYIEQDKKLGFKFSKKGGEKFAVCSLDKESFVALILTPGEYYLQDSLLGEFKAGGVYIIKGEEAPAPSKAVTYQQYLGDRQNRYLSKNIFSEDENIKSAAGFFSNQVRTAEVFGHNLGKTLLWGFYIIRSPFWCIHWLTYPCVFSCNPAGLAVGGLIYLLTFWAVPQSQRKALEPLFGKAIDTVASSPRSRQSKQILAPSNSTVVKPNAYGPGIHSDQYGRPVTVNPL